MTNTMNIAESVAPVNPLLNAPVNALVSSSTQPSFDITKEYFYQAARQPEVHYCRNARPLRKKGAQDQDADLIESLLCKFNQLRGVVAVAHGCEKHRRWHIQFFAGTADRVTDVLQSLHIYMADMPIRSSGGLDILTRDDCGLVSIHCGSEDLMELENVISAIKDDEDCDW